MFITFEGIEGSGKTTQAKILTQYLNEQNLPAVFTREPGGTILAEDIRSLILKNNGISDPLTEFLLFTAARYDHVENFIKPKLRDGHIVICDRFFDSTLAYQGGVKGLSFEKIYSIHHQVFGDFIPDMTFLIDVSPKISLNRIIKDREMNHYDKRDLLFHNQVRELFLKIAQDKKSRVKVIDGSSNPDQITQAIVNALYQSKMLKLLQA